MSGTRPIVSVALLAAVLMVAPLQAATPPSGSISGSNLSVAWTGGPVPSTASADCKGDHAADCDNFSLQIVPPPYPFEVEIRLVPQGADDWDLQVYGPDGSFVRGSGNVPSQPETVILINPPAGTYSVRAAPFVVALPYGATARITPHVEPANPDPSAEREPTYANFPAPAPLGQAAGEPTLGVNEKTGSIMYVSYTQSLRVGIDPCSSPGRAKWEDVSFLTTNITSLDPILYTQQDTGRTVVSQLLFPTKQSAMAFTDDDGESWTASQGSGINCGVDHQGVGGGPWAPGGISALATYPRAIYYCAQDIALAECAVSLDGGLTFGPGVPIYNLSECGGLHGHPKVAPDGTVYVPNKGCGSEQAVIVSTDNGQSWKVKNVPGARSGNWDPTVAVGANGTVYFGYDDVDGHPRVAVSRDRGNTWTDIQDVGVKFGIQNIAFPVMIAGDDDRAAFAFLGTTQYGGGSGDDATWPGVWYLYVSHTYDGGKSWVTTNATPNDPVQRGTICSGGINCATTRNLLDFMDITVDQEGRALVAFADGCIGSCVTAGPNSFSEVGTISRQVSGKRLYAKFDTVGTPHAPTTDAALKNGSVFLNWQTPDDRGSAISSYNIYERNATTTPTRIASVPADFLSYTDATPAGFYEVRAVNASGEGRGCEVVPTTVPTQPVYDTCNAPGALVAPDGSGDSVAGALDVLSVSAAELRHADGVHRVTFTVKVRDLSTMTAGNSWYLIWNRPLPGVDFDRNYVVMRATGSDTAEFKYGKLVPPSVNQAVDHGTADSGSFSKADNTITITIATNKIDSPAAGQDLAGIHARVFLASADGLVVTQSAAQDFTAPGNYTLRGFAHCTTNRAPDAVNDTASTRKNKPVTIALLANDSDPDGDAISVTTIGKPANGTLVSKKDGKASYKPNDGFVGTDVFSYTISDGKGGTDTASVTVTVTDK